MGDCHVVTAAGYVLVGYIIYRLLTALYNIFYPYFIAKPIADLPAFCGADWAVVTGSTDGIGKAYALELAKRGFNVVLISRSQAKLDAVKTEIESAVSGREVRTIAYDYTDGDAEHYKQRIGAQLAHLAVGILVNNVGMSHEYPDRLTDMDGGLQRLGNIVTVNTLPVALMTALVLPEMVKRGSGVVVNISSGSSAHPMALWAAYSSTKKFVDWFTDILQQEYEGTGVTIQLVNPMLVATNLSKLRKTTFVAPGPAHFVRSAINTIGLMDQTNGCFSHQIQGELGKGLPSAILKRLLMQQSAQLRAKALRKREKDTAKRQ